MKAGKIFKQQKKKEKEIGKANIVAITHQFNYELLQETYVFGGDLHSYSIPLTLTRITYSLNRIASKSKL